MARLVRRYQSCQDSETGKKILTLVEVWHGRYADADGEIRILALSADTATAQAMLDELVRRTEGWANAIGMDVPGEIGSSCECAECGHVYGWHGGFLEMPPCPKCGWRPQLSTLALAILERKRQAEELHD